MHAQDTIQPDILSHIEVLKQALESSYDGIHILDKNGRTLYINEACTRIEGILREEAERYTIQELVSMGHYSESVSLKVLEKGKSVTIKQRAKNGNSLLVTGSPVYIGGSLECVVVNSRDMTGLNRLKAELEEKETLARKYQEEVELLRLERSLQNGPVAKSRQMEKVLHVAGMVARVDSSVLISGESGVGKGVISRYVHDNSRRRDGPFITIDCGAIPETIFESELFGYEKGAFTGAAPGGKLGLLELAEGGTLFLDEIGEIPLSLQPKLLQALNDRKFRRVGGNKWLSLDVRVIAATNKDLQEMMAHSTFREDLYYRIAVVPLTIPPLRERPEDILPHIIETLQRVNSCYGWSKSLSQNAVRCLEAYSWPGNVRELENFVERVAVTTTHDSIGEDDLPQAMLEAPPICYEPGAFSGLHYKTALARFDYGLISKAIAASKGSMEKAAEMLNINVTTLRRKLQKYKHLP